MRHTPEDKWDAETLERVRPEQWQIDLLALNPGYCGWGPHEDYMIVRGEGWNSPMLYASWREFSWQLNELNECFNFYFEVERDEDASAAHVSLVLWMGHPRKGATRGVEIKRVERSDLPSVFAWLKTAADRNAERFAAVVAKAVS